MRGRECDVIGRNCNTHIHTHTHRQTHTQTDAMSPNAIPCSTLITVGHRLSSIRYCIARRVQFFSELRSNAIVFDSGRSEKIVVIPGAQITTGKCLGGFLIVIFRPRLIWSIAPVRNRMARGWVNAACAMIWIYLRLYTSGRTRNKSARWWIMTGYRP